MPMHDYKCRCGRFVRDVTERPTECECGDPDFAVSYCFWSKFNEVREFKSESDLTDDKGFRRLFTATEDPTCMIEMGLLEGNGIKTFHPEQVREYQERLVKDGDTPRLRKQILQERQRNMERGYYG